MSRLGWVQSLVPHSAEMSRFDWWRMVEQEVEDPTFQMYGGPTDNETYSRTSKLAVNQNFQYWVKNSICDIWKRVIIGKNSKYLVMYAPLFRFLKRPQK